MTRPSGEPMEVFDSLTWLRGLIVVATALGAVAILANKEREVHRTPAMRALGLAAVLLGAGALVYVGWRVIAPPPEIASVELSPGAPPFVSPTLPDDRLELLVHGKLGEDGHAQGEGHYAVRASVGGSEHFAWTGTLSQKVQTRKYMRRGRTNIAVMHLEGRHALPREAAGKSVALEVTKQDGKLVGPLSLSVVYAPPPEVPLLLAGCVLAFIGGVVDKSAKAAKTWLGLGTAMLFALALLLLEAPHPLTASHLLRSVPVAAMGGGLVGGLLRALAGLFFRTKAEPKPAAA